MKYLEALLISALAVFAPIQASLVALALLTLVDMLTGVFAAYKRGEKITSAGLRRSVSKIFVYEIAVLMAYVGEKYLLSEIVPITKIVLGAISVTEIKSLFENLDSISGQPLLKSIIDKLGSKNNLE